MIASRHCGEAELRKESDRYWSCCDSDSLADPRPIATRRDRTNNSISFRSCFSQAGSATISNWGGPWTVTHGRFRAETGHVRSVIGWAYNLLPAQVKGGPDWINREPYYFDARAGDPEAGPEPIRTMLQALLAERFKMVVHRDTQQGQVYTLVVGKNGSKL